jgi:hypothetical protein
MQIDYTNLIYFILEMSGLDINTGKGITKHLDPSNCCSEEVLDEIISKYKVKIKKFKTGKVYLIFETICEEIYNK